MSKDGFLYSSEKIDVNKKISIVASKWNAELVNELLESGKVHLEELGFTNIKIVHVPGAWELVHAAQKELEDADARRDAMRKMAWFSLLGMLLYPFAVVLANLIGLEQAGKILGDMAATYFVSVAAIVMGFFGANAYSDKKKK